MFSSAIAKDSLTGKRVLVTGAGGFIGSRLVERLLGVGARVCAASRTEGRLKEMVAHGGYDFTPCDLTHEAETANLFRQFAPQIVYHFASHPDGRECYTQARRAIEVNLLGTLNALEAFRLASADAELFVYGDTCKVYGEALVPYRAGMPVMPLSSYAIAKASGWQLCQLYAKLHGTPIVSVRPTLIYGPQQGFNLISFVVECVLGGKNEVPLDGGGQTRDPLFIEDALEAFLTVAQRGSTLAGQVLNIGGGAECAVRDIAELIIKLMGARIPVVSLPAGARPTDMQRSHCDNREVAELIGWRPRTDLTTGLRRTIEHLLHVRRHQAGEQAPPATLPIISSTVTPVGEIAPALISQA